ncbi:lysophospholipid acyltransferase family protein [Variovorax sp. JS1663]|uniref:lysophospholipid acyltransferase family protein n=1 Tax=Variovorax sp. JS1663 TaxID=1851577 RepID=UPI000B34754D|nr:lysophospholipid acyltransferase family protein [Variovorax sp. JS1663]OUM01865.1 acyltransferase [Variovorax sp. JS1663]
MKRLLRWILAIPLALMLYALLLVLGGISLLWNLVAMLLYPVLPAGTGRTLGRAVIAWSYRAFWGTASTLGMMRIDASCLDALRDERGLIFVANHPTMLDALLLVARLPRSACIMKADLMRNIFLGAGARLARYIRNDSARTMIKLAVEDLQAGGQLVIFPEGTRTVTPPLNAFRPGVTLIAKLAQAPIQTVFIDTDSPYLAKGWPLWRVPPLPIVFTLRLGRRFAPQQNSDALLAEIEQYFRHPMEQRANDAQPACQQSRAPTLS